MPSRLLATALHDLYAPHRKSAYALAKSPVSQCQALHSVLHGVLHSHMLSFAFGVEWWHGAAHV